MERILDAQRLREAVEDSQIMHLESEYKTIPSYMPSMRDMPEGVRHLNRYTNVLPNLATAVKLDGSDQVSQYINANYVSGYDKSKNRFIATQGPTPATIPHFWQMVWEQQSQFIVMTTSLMEKSRVKCERYWPDEEGVATDYGRYEITITNILDCGEHMQTSLRMKEKASGQTRNLKHFWYTAWPDHGVPDSPEPVIEFLRAVREVSQQSTAPIVVHCSAGIGRTGTFMAIDIGMQELQSEWRVVDVLRIVNEMRQERPGSVQTFVQYRFIHQALVHYITPGLKSSMFGVEKPREVTLQKVGGLSFGFTLRGSYPTFMVRVDHGGLAERKGVRIGDHILAINGKDSQGLTHNDVVNAIRASGDTIRFTLLSKTPY